MGRQESAGAGISTPEGLFSGTLTYLQPASGFRTSVDSLALCYFLDTQVQEGPTLALDVGCGSGFICLVMARHWAQTRFVAIENSVKRAKFAKKNVRENDLEQRVQVIEGSVCDPRPDWNERFEVVFCNPPFFECGSGTLPTDRDRAIARFELTLSVRDLFRVSQTVLKEQGAVFCIYPEERAPSVLEAGRDHGFDLVSRQSVQSRSDRAPRWDLYHWVKCGSTTGPAASLQNLVLESEDGALGPELKRFVVKTAQ